MVQPDGVLEDWRVEYDNGDPEFGFMRGRLYSPGWPQGIPNFTTEYVPALSVGKVFKKGDIVVCKSPRQTDPHGAIFKLGDPRV